MSEAITDEVKLNKLIGVYIKIRDKKLAIVNEMKKQEQDLEEKLDLVKTALLEHCKATGLESGKTELGSFYRSVKTKY